MATTNTLRMKFVTDLGNETTISVGYCKADLTAETVQEAMEINGIGPVKAATVVPLFLEAIRLWRAAEREARDG